MTAAVNQPIEDQTISTTGRQASYRLKSRPNLLDMSLPEGIACILVLIGVHILTYHYNYLFFHTIAEIFSIFIAVSIFIITVNCWQYIVNPYFKFVGISYLFVASLDLLHTLSYKGMPIFTDYDYYAPQFWIASRYMEAISTLIGFYFLWTQRSVNFLYTSAVYIIITFLLSFLILYFNAFPICFIPGHGLTPFKIYSEYAISSIILLNIFILYTNREKFDKHVYYKLFISMILMIFMELSFTLFVSDAMNDLFNEVGHLLKVCAFYLVYKALVVTALRDPMTLLFLDLKRSESRLQEAQRLARLGQWEWDRASDGYRWSAEMYNLFGADAAKKPTFKLMTRCLDPHKQKELRDALDRTERNGEPFDIMLRLHHPHNGLRFAQLRCQPDLDERGQIAGLSGTVQDVTEQQEMMEKAQAANQAKSAFLANMSHELRTPLNAILGFANMLLIDRGATDAQRRNLSIITRSGEHLLGLINDVLDMAKIESGRMEIGIKPFDLGNMLRDITDMMRLRAQEKGLQLLIDQSSRFPRYIKGDEPHLRQILINLLSNAVKFTSSGGISLRLGTYKNDVDHLLIEVEDSGLGIPEGDQKRIFEPFVQLGPQGINKGTGLGLTITRQFVEMMGGTITLDSERGKGSLFRISLPLWEVSEADIAKAEDFGPGEVAGLAPNQPRYRILIVEDQYENQLLLARLMEKIDQDVRVAGNGRDAVRIFQSWRPDLIWMDQRMPVMNGIDAAKAIRALPFGLECKIIAVTASAFTEERAELMAAGMDDFVRKPYRFNEIYECLSRQLGLTYAYQDRPSEPSGTVETMSGERLGGLPPDLRADLKAALESLDAEQIAAIIRRIEPIDKSLYAAIDRLVANFDYPAILNVLKTGELKTGELKTMEPGL